jgi:hypothetical protein
VRIFRSRPDINEKSRRVLIEISGEGGVYVYIKNLLFLTEEMSGIVQSISFRLGKMMKIASESTIHSDMNGKILIIQIKYCNGFTSF